MKIKKAVVVTSVNSNIKELACGKDGRRAFLAFFSNNAGDTKYSAIPKKRMNLLQNIKCNGRS